MKWYSGQGDDGWSSVYGGGREAKDSARFHALGTLDEASSAMGMARALARQPGTDALLRREQAVLYLVMAEVAALHPDSLRERVNEQSVIALETDIAALAVDVAMPPTFILPGDTVGGASLDVARAVVRRAERQVVAFCHESGMELHAPLRYLNRLSSLLYLLARREDQP